MRYLSVCSGIEAATVAWAPLGWELVAVAEIDPFACHVLHHHYDVGRPLFMPTPAFAMNPTRAQHKENRKRAAALKRVAALPAGCGINFGDLARFKEWPDADFDVLVGGTPCQSFSVAGLRKGLADPRGNLALTYLAIADRYRPRWVVWENVPGVRSVNAGAALGSFLGGLGELGYGFCYRSLDAQYFGLAQRRERVFVVGYLGDWRRAAAVLLEPESLRGDPAPRRNPGEAAAGTLAARSTAGGGLGTDFDLAGGVDNAASQITGTLRSTDGGVDVTEAATGQLVSHAITAHPSGRMDATVETFVTGALQAGGKAAGSVTQQDAENGMMVVVTPIAEAGKRTRSKPASPRLGDGLGAPGDPMFTLGTDSRHAVAFKASHFTRGKDGAPANVAPPLSADADKGDQDTLIAFNPRQDPDASGPISHPLGSKDTGHAIAFMPARNFGADGGIDSSFAERDIANALHTGSGAGNKAPLIAFSVKDHGADAGDIAPTLRSMNEHGGNANGGGQVGIAFAERGSNVSVDGDIAATMKAAGDNSGGRLGVQMGSTVRRLMPIECERLQGFPDHFTLVPYRGKPAADGPRYRALGNSMATNCMRWLGERIDLVEDVIREIGA